MKLLLALASVALSQSAPAEVTQEKARFRPGDLIVKGHVATRDYETLDSEFSLSAIMVADLKISKVLKGRPPSRTLTIRYIAHMDLPRDGEFTFHLRRSAGRWVACRKGLHEGYVCG
ncbi:hypothetical protein J2W22_001246 [Sphingomonas kyeonggiensis]|nr:hypothetical protein [Sphingomonas kyeonggiensis]